MPSLTTDLFLLHFHDDDVPHDAAYRTRIAETFVNLVHLRHRERTLLHIKGLTPADLDDIADRIDRELCPLYGAAWIHGGLVIERTVS